MFPQMRDDRDKRTNSVFKEAWRRLPANVKQKYYDLAAEKKFVKKTMVLAAKDEPSIEPSDIVIQDSKSSFNKKIDYNFERKLA